MLLSSSSHGNVISTNLSNITDEKYEKDEKYGNEKYGNDEWLGIGLGLDERDERDRINRKNSNYHEILIQEPARVSSIDCEKDTGMMLAVSACGGLWRTQLK
jgi:hypothetical protein